MSDVVRTVAGSRADCELVPRGDLELKGLPEPVRLWRVAWAPAPEPEQLPFPPLLESRQALAFSGREGELTAVLDAWKDASGGSRRCVVVSGEPGIGKTRLVGEAARVAHCDGALVLYGRCDDELGVPFQPFAEALDWYMARAEELVMGRWPGDLARLAPQLRDQVRNLPAPLEADAESEQYRLFDAVASWLTALSAEQPVVVVLDDLHWATKPTLLMLRHVVRTTGPARLLVVVTYRETDVGAEHPLAATLASLHREPGVERITLGGLDADALGLVLEAAGYELDAAGAALRDTLVAETDGNPFFVGQVLRHLVESGAVAQREDGRWIAELRLRDHGALPTSVREVIERRVARLGEETTQTLETAAVIGRDFELELLARVTDRSEDHVVDLLEGAVRAMLIRDAPDRPGRMSFSHALTEHTLYDGISPTRRQRMHVRVAASLEALCGDEAGGRLGELAHHWAHATKPADVSKAIEYAQGAGDEALVRLAPHEALRWYAQALELIDRQRARDEDARCNALLGVGVAQRDSGDPESRRTLLDAAHLAQRLGNAALLARAAVENSARGQASTIGDVDADRVAVLEAALVATPETATSERATLLAFLASELTWVDRDRARTLSDAALGLARELEDDLTLWNVLGARFTTICSPATLDERAANAREQWQAAERLGSPYHAEGAAGRVLMAAAERGDLVEVDEYLDRAARFTAETDLPWSRAATALFLAWRRLLAGRIDESEEAAAEALQMATDWDPNAFSFYAAQIYDIRRAQGRLGEIIEVLEQAVAANPGLPVFRAMLATALCEIERAHDARDVFEPLVEHRFEQLAFDVTWLTAMTHCAEVAAYLEHRRAAEILTELLAPWRGRFVSTGITCAGSVARPLGLLLGAAGCLDEADEALAEAAAPPTHRRAHRARAHPRRLGARAGDPGPTRRPRPGP